MGEDSSGHISYEEWKACATNPHLMSQIEMFGISAKDTMVLFNILDVKGDREVSIFELIDGFNRLKGFATSLDAHQVLSRVNYCIDQNDAILDHLAVQDSDFQMIKTSSSCKRKAAAKKKE